MFAGPPPPISRSIMKPSRASAQPAPSPQGFIQASRSQLGSLIFDRKQAPSRERAPKDNTWRQLHRREQAIEQEIQQLLDLQATGLVAGSGMTSNNHEGYSDTGSSTPTGTFYSTASTRSRMINSIHMPARSTPDGNVIPVRQPTGGKPLGLRSARVGLQRAISSLAELKQEEDTQVDAALLDRKRALNHVRKLAKQKANVESELKNLEQDNEEPLGKELRELSTKFDDVTSNIRQLEEQLQAMRNHRRSLRERMEDITSRREAGLSGYKGALKDATKELSSLMLHPPIQPLDEQIFKKNVPAVGSDNDALSGQDFMKLIPERRTAEMALAWWEDEVAVLEARREQIGKEKKALEEGSQAWREVVTLVHTFESNLRSILKTGRSSKAASSPKGKEKVPTPEELITAQLEEMDDVVNKLQERLEEAEDKEWNLLICAIGAELEAFCEARDMLKAATDPASQQEQSATSKEPIKGTANSSHADESDNEVPPDLLVSHAETPSAGTSQESGEAENHPLRRRDSENEVPAEFLAEHSEE